MVLDAIYSMVLIILDEQGMIDEEAERETWSTETLNKMNKE
jgi:hypothetical protein